MITKAGTYKAKAFEAMLGRSSERKTPFVGIKFRVIDGEFNGQTVKWEGYLTDKTAERTLESLQHCGWTGDDISVFATGLNGLDKNEVELQIEMEPGSTDPTKEYPKVQWVNRAGGGAKFAGEAMDAAAAADFGKKFRGLALSLKAKAGATPEKKKDDGIPF